MDYSLLLLFIVLWPLNPVESVEVLFGEKRAKITWCRPRLLGGQGKGSWEKWMYEVELKDNSKTIERINVPENTYDISNLKPNTSYSVKVRAFSEGGKGPWSSEFKGSTLRSSEKSNFPYVLYGGQGLLRSDFLGDNLEPLIDKMTLNNALITDISWYDEILFISTNATFLYVYNSSIEPSLTRLPNITMATSIAIDWFAPKLYWSSAVLSQIARSNIDGSQPEPLPILTMAKEIAIDSVHAHLYWVTAHSVERSHLNGMNHFVYMKNDFFSGRHVMGLTLDFDSEKLFYMVRSYEGSILYRACLAKNNNPPCNPEEPEVVGSLSENGSHGPVGYYSHRVFWLHENQQAFVSDIKGNNLARMRREGLNGLTSMEIIDPSLHPYPKGLDMNTIKVVPAPIFEKDIQICGTHNRFNITWVPVANVNYGKVFYEITLDDGSEVFSLITNETVFVYPSIKRLPPFTPLTIGIQSFTYFASSKLTIALLRSPSSIPSKPLHPRIFVMHKSSPLERNTAILVLLRWSPPEKANGIIKNYEVDCWNMVNETKVKIFHDLVPGKVIQYQAKHLLPNTTYFLQVFAYTEAGPGEASDIVKAETSIERPVPKLLLAKSDSVKVADFDFHEEKLLLIKATHPAAIAYMALEKKIFVLEEEGSLMVSSLDGTNTSLIKHLGTEGTSLSIDWIGRKLYWVEIDKEAHQSSVWSIDLSYNSYPKKIFERPCKIKNIEVEPFSGSLIYTRAFRNNYDLMISDTNGSNVRPFFMQYTEAPTSNKLKVKRNKSLISMPLCNCSKTATVGPAITIDNSDKAHLKILFVDSLYGHIYSSDIQGCICKILINGTESYGLPPTSITVDSEKIYWSNLTTGKIYSMNKIKQHLDSELPVVQEIKGIRSIRAIGHHIQPFPDVSCLLTESYSFRAELIGKSSSSLTLHLPDVQRPAVCKKISTPSVLYTLYYGAVSEASNSSCFISNDLKRCKVLSTYSKNVVLENLDPFTNYSIRVSVMNYYSRGLSTLGPEALYETVVGTPSPPIHLNAYSVTPHRIDIRWKTPLKPNGFPIFYEIRWKTRNSTRDSISTIQSECGKDSTSHLSGTILTTEAGKDHYITVRAYSSDCQKFSDSKEIMVTAFSLPNNLTLVNVTSSSICLSWRPPEDNSIVKHLLEYSEVGYNNWFSINSCNESTVPANPLQIFLLENLNPKTKYKFRLILTYGEIGEIFLFPEGFTFEYMTSGDVPSVPGKPQVEHVGSRIYKVGWEESNNNGEMDILYELEFRSNEDGEKVNEWKFVKNTTITQYILSNFSGNTKYEFRIRAFNEYGKSNFSYSDKLFYMPEARALIEKPTGDPYGVVIASSVATVVLISVFLAILYIVHLKKEKCKKNLLQETAASNQLAPDLELATLEDLPLHANLVQTNALYNLFDLPTDEELLALPQIHKENIVVTKFLGSGAFGEVFEGIVNGEGESHHQTMKVAIKALKKGASDFEKDEFLKEAKLMSNLKHDHILELIGVCFDNTTKCIILELMEGGDLLSYLRSNRPTAWKSSDLTIQDLMKICLDVAEGCRFLESMHFVHRDLAARNCLVTSRNRHERRVKIGDFGLARDIYKNDYYRKEGEGLMPVRWMAPESLVYGIFTCQSDVWAFGVILWEVMTLGMQPYPARSNLEVLHYVRHGGILEKPENCPEELHQIMQACWTFEAEARPSFHQSLRSLKELHRLTPSSNIPIVYNLNYFNPEHLVYGTYAGTYDEEESEVELLDANLDSRSTQSDPAIAASENVHDTNLCAMRRSMSCMTLQSTNRQSASSRRMPTRTNERQATNKYLELLGDNEDSDGYQRPLKAKKPREPTPRKHRVTPRLPMASPSSSYEDMHPSLSLNPLPFFSQLSDAGGSSDLPGACRESLQHSPASCELDSILQPSQSKGSASNSVKSWMDDCDKWSFSTASTATCQLDNNLGSQDNLTSAISCIAGIDINHPSTSSNC
ncbi:hypothetical protein JTE90_024054 [Oedothorax gibbosus]|uniref:Tyrosine-protein kinase receptor n=1 Tax=Oedothorax gibbosus TaxID=931172 RepID=A0AAV6VCS0_9ARAC|nr:hypothetical protein JTE90_024054 [Oedothorax gibbosus]